MTEEQVREAIQAKAADGRAACKALLDLAVETQTPPRQIGRLCDEMGIKIVACQLGCFR